MLDLLNTSYRVRREKLLAQFRPRQRPPEGATSPTQACLKNAKALNILFYITV